MWLFVVGAISASVIIYHKERITDEGINIYFHLKYFLKNCNKKPISKDRRLIQMNDYYQDLAYRHPVFFCARNGNIRGVKKYLMQPNENPVKQIQKIHSGILAVATWAKETNLIAQVIKDIVVLPEEEWVDRFYLATELGYSAILEIFINSIAEKLNLSPEKKQAFIKKLLHNVIVLAASLGHNAIIQILINKFGKNFFKDAAYNPIGPKEAFFPLSETPLHAAAQMGHLSTLQILHQAEFNINITNGVERTPLMVAAFAGQRAVINYLVCVNGIELDRQDTNGMTALMCACYSRHPIIVRILLQAKARTEIFSEKKNRTAFSFVAESEQTDILDIFLEVDLVYWTILDALFLVIKQKREKLIFYLLNVIERKIKGLDESSKHLHNTSFHFTLLLAAKSGLNNLVRPLLNMGIDPNVAGMDGATALITAVYYCQSSFIDTLLQYSVDVDFPAIPLPQSTSVFWEGETALMVACRFGFSDFLKILNKNRKLPNANAKRNDGQTALMIAASANVESTSILTDLLTLFKADIDVRCDNNKTALMYALENRATRKNAKSTIFVLLNAEISKSILGPHWVERRAEHVNSHIQSLCIFLSECEFEINEEDNFVIKTASLKNYKSLGIPEGIKKITLTREGVKKIVALSAAEEIAKNDNNLSRLIWTLSQEQESREYAALEKTIFEMPEVFNGELYNMDPLFEKIRDAKKEINEDLEILAQYINGLDFKTNSERRKKAKNTELENLKNDFLSIAIPDEKFVTVVLRENFNTLYDKIYLSILDKYLAEEHLESRKLQQDLEKIFIQLRAFQEKFTSGYKMLLQIKSRIKETIIKYKTENQKAMHSELIRQEKLRAAEEIAQAEKTRNLAEKIGLNRKEEEDRKRLAAERNAAKEAWLRKKEVRQKQREQLEEARRTEREKRKQERLAERQNQKALKTTSRAVATYRPKAKEGKSGLAQLHSYMETNTDITLKTVDIVNRHPRVLLLSDLAPIGNLAGEVEELELLDNIITTLESSGSMNERKMEIEDVMIVRYAILGTITRLMEHIKELKGVKEFSAEKAKKCRDVIYHGHHHLFKDIDNETMGVSVSDNVKIIEMARKLLKKLKTKEFKLSNSIVVSKSIASKTPPSATRAVNADSDSEFLESILKDNNLEDPSDKVCLAELRAGDSKIARLSAYLFGSGIYATHYHIMNAAFGFMYGKLGMFASCLKRNNYKEFSKNLKKYEEYIKYGKDFRHGKAFYLENLENPYGSLNSTFRQNALKGPRL
jgi:ankyrin repeat protein